MLEETIKGYREDIEDFDEEQRELREEIKLLKAENERIRKANKAVSNEVQKLTATKRKNQIISEFKDKVSGVVNKTVFNQARGDEMDTTTTMHNQLVE